MSSSNLPMFWQELLIQTLRLAGRVGVQLMRLSLSDMKDLLGVALCRELQERDFRTSDMCVAIGVSRTTVKKYLKMSRELGEQPLQPEALRMAVMRLQSGPVSLDQLRRRLPLGDEFDTAEVALQLLVTRGLAEAMVQEEATLYRLTDAARRLDDPDWEEPLKEMSLRYVLGRDVVRLLFTESPLTQSQIQKKLKLRGEQADLLVSTLELLKDMGSLEHPEQFSRAWRLTNSHLMLIPSDDRSKVRVGLLDLLEKTGSFLETVLSREDHGPIGQRTFEFNARPEDMAEFLKAHREWVIDRLKPLEENARAKGDGKTYILMWAASPIIPPERN